MTRNVRVCKVCGARYATPGIASRHTANTGHNEWKTVKETIPETVSRIYYQPGHEPKGEK